MLKKRVVLFRSPRSATSRRVCSFRSETPLRGTSNHTSLTCRSLTFSASRTISRFLCCAMNRSQQAQPKWRHSHPRIRWSSCFLYSTLPSSKLPFPMAAFGMMTAHTIAVCQLYRNRSARGEDVDEAERQVDGWRLLVQQNTDRRCCEEKAPIRGFFSL